jgi:hypothetical protein
VLCPFEKFAHLSIGQLREIIIPVIDGTMPHFGFCFLKARLGCGGSLAHWITVLLTTDFLPLKFLPRRRLPNG